MLQLTALLLNRPGWSWRSPHEVTHIAAHEIRSFHLGELMFSAQTTESDGPLVSVITATFNAVATLPECLKSVRDQQYPRVEHLVMDGGSTDGTLQLLQTFMRPGLRVYSEADSGIYDAWNKGLQQARGEWIAFLGADDRYHTDAIAAYMRLAAAHPHAEYLSSQVRWTSGTGKVRVIGQRWAWPRFQRYMCTAHVGSLHRRALFQRLGEYNAKLRMVGDYELLLRAGPELPTAFLPQVTALVRAGGVTDSVEALDESAQVKRSTGQRSAALVGTERLWAELSLRTRRAIDRLP